MKHSRSIETSQMLEKRLAESIDRVRGQITKQRAIKNQILSMRRARRQLEAIPDEVKEWFEETEEMLEEE